ncbi:MAG: SLC13 family permease [Sedimentibacter sp.]
MLAWMTIIAAILAFSLGTIANLNIGVLCIGFGFLASLVSGGTGSELVDALSASNVFIFVGVNLLFTAAFKNGFIQVLCDKLLYATGGRRWVMPFAFAAVGGIVAGIGAGAAPAAALMASPAMTMAKKTKIPTFLMAVVVLHGIFIGMYSPLSGFAIPILALITNSVGVNIAGKLFIWSALFEITALVVAFLLFGGLKLIKEDKELGSERIGIEGVAKPAKFDSSHYVTIISLILLFAGVMTMGRTFNIGIGAIALGLIVIIFSRKKGVTDVDVIKAMPWGTIMLVIGAMTLMTMMENVGGTKLIIAGIQSLNLGIYSALLLIILAGLTSFYASSLAIVLALIPMAILLMTDMGMAYAIPGLTIAICISATMVDVSPVSNNGALFVAANSVADPESNAGLFKKMFAYGFAMIFLGSIFSFIALVLL